MSIRGSTSFHEFVAREWQKVSGILDGTNQSEAENIKQGASQEPAPSPTPQRFTPSPDSKKAATEVQWPLVTESPASQQGSTSLRASQTKEKIGTRDPYWNQGVAERALKEIRSLYDKKDCEKVVSTALSILKKTRYYKNTTRMEIRCFQFRALNYLGRYQEVNEIYNKSLRYFLIQNQNEIPKLVKDAIVEQVDLARERLKKNPNTRKRKRSEIEPFLSSSNSKKVPETKTPRLENENVIIQPRPSRVELEDDFTTDEEDFDVRDEAKMRIESQRHTFSGKSPGTQSQPIQNSQEFEQKTSKPSTPGNQIPDSFASAKKVETPAQINSEKKVERIRDLYQKENFLEAKPLAEKILNGIQISREIRSEVYLIYLRTLNALNEFDQVVSIGKSDVKNSIDQDCLPAFKKEVKIAKACLEFRPQKSFVQTTTEKQLEQVRSLNDQRDHDAALKQVEKILSGESNFDSKPTAYLEQVRAYNGKGQYEKALSQIEIQTNKRMKPELKALYLLEKEKSLKGFEEQKAGEISEVREHTLNLSPSSIENGSNERAGEVPIPIFLSEIFKK